LYPKIYFELFRQSDLTNEVFVAMSFDPSQVRVWSEIFCPAIRHLDLEPYRVDQMRISDSILTDILAAIRRARLILCDISKIGGVRNGNVMYELGLAHAVRLPQEVIIVKSDHDIPLFDIEEKRAHEYNQNDIDRSVSLISDLLREAQNRIERERAEIVRKTSAELDDSCLRIIDQFRDSSEGWHIPYDQTMESVLANMHSRFAVRRLLEFGVIRCDYSSDRREYAYHWTEFGQALIRYLQPSG